MQPARDQDASGEDLHLVFLATPASIRDNLAHLMARPPLSDLPDDSRGSAELVLAEVLNNIAEHAYDAGQGPVAVTLALRPSGIACLIVDQGGAMPDGKLPDIGLPEVTDLAPEDLPEGGFGWPLIRILTRDLTYQRTGGCNRLRFTLPFDA
jgi:serine/threonine-protein kinase RsbW